MTTKITQGDTTITLTERGGKYQAVWYADGKRHRKSTGTSDLGEAEHVARGFLTATRPGSDMTLMQGLEKIWAESWSEQTTDVRRTYVKQAADLWGNPRLVDITRDMLMDLRTWHRTQGTSETTTNRKIQPLLTILNTAHHDWQIIPKPAPRVKRFKESKGRYRYLSDQEVADLIEAADEPFDLIFRFAVETGCRRGEVMSLTWGMVDFQGNNLLIPGAVTKTDQTRAIPLDDDMLKLLERRKQAQVEELTEGEQVAPGTAAGSMRRRKVFPEATPATLRRQWSKIRCRLAMDDDDDYVFHTLRHTCATRLTKKGVPTDSIKAWLGHADIATTIRYLNQSAEDLQQYRSHAKCVS